MKSKCVPALIGTMFFILACGLLTPRNAPEQPTLASEPALTASSAATPSDATGTLPQVVLERSLDDRPDDSPGDYQIHILYVIPADGQDRGLDTSGTLNRSFAAMQKWLKAQTYGSTLRLDMYNGALDISFHRLALNNQQAATYLNSNAYVRDAIEADLASQGLLQRDKLYAVYYDGLSTFACGGGAWPPDLPGQVAALYLQGAYDGVLCANDSFAPDPDHMAINEYKMIHEILHTLGFAPACAPHHTRAGHTSDDPHDLLYAGDQPWYPDALDALHDDYFRAGNPDCLDLTNSVFLDPMPMSAQKPPAWP